MTKEQIKVVLDRVLTWPREAQEEAIASLQTIEKEFMGSHELSAEDHEALERSAQDVRHGRLQRRRKSIGFLTAIGVNEGCLHRYRTRRDRKNSLIH